MYKPTFNKRQVLVFHHFGNKGYSLFSCLGREVVCSVLSVATLTYASAESISTNPVVTDADIAQAPVQSINDLLKYAVGVDVRQRGPIGAQTDISIRGGTSEQIIILLNGINICDPQTGHNVMDLPIDLHRGARRARRPHLWHILARRRHQHRHPPRLRHQCRLHVGRRFLRLWQDQRQRQPETWAMEQPDKCRIQSQRWLQPVGKRFAEH